MRERWRHHTICALVATIAIGALVAIRVHRPHAPDPVAVAFLGCCETNGLPHAVLRVRNNTTTALEFGAGYAAAGDFGSMRGGVQVHLSPKRTGEVFVPILPTSRPVQIVLESRITATHAPWLLLTCGVLDHMGVHLYHTFPSPRARVRVVFGKPPGRVGVPFASCLVYYSSTNSLEADPLKKMQRSAS